MMCKPIVTALYLGVFAQADSEPVPTPAEPLQLFGITMWQWLGLIALAGGAYLLGILLQWVLVSVGRSVARRTTTTWDERVIDILPGPARFFLALMVFYIAKPILELEPAAGDGVDLVVRVLLILVITWFALRFLVVSAEFIQEYLTRNVEDDSRIRSVRTQIAIPKIILRWVIVLLGVSLILLQFEVVRSVGVSLLASAGLVGIFVGLAAQKTISNVLAGIQLAIFQPMRIGDAVIVENEWGWIEEIGLTYVVVKIWDLRRLIIPVSYFLERPFQNWTKSSTDLLGTVMLYTDYSVPIDAIRTELDRILQETDLWDKTAAGVQVTNLTDRAVEVRILVSASDGGRLWNLCCWVREKMVTWLQAQGPGSLPMHRLEMQPAQKRE